MDKSLHPGFKLNLHNTAKNPMFGSHDPSMMFDPVSGYAYSYCTDGGINSEYKQGIPVRKSRNMVDFEFVGHALSEKAVSEGRDNGEFPPTPGFWAPFTEYVNGEYRMYYSATKAFGSSESRIWLAVADKPEGPFENRGVVMDTWGTDNTYPNAIDPHIVDDRDGSKYLIYGSYFGGIYIKELDAATGLAKNGDAFSLGKRIAHKPKGAHVDGPEGAAVIYVPSQDYFYLFLSYGWLADTYDTRVGRSKCITGPYVDMDGRDLVEETLGQKLAGSYFFSGNKPYVCEVSENTYVSEADAKRAKKANDGSDGEHRRPVVPESISDWEFGGFRGPGHGVPFYHNKMDRYFYIHHIRDGSPKLVHRAEKPGDLTSYMMNYMMIRAMYFVNGWPVVSPETFAGEEGVTEISFTPDEKGNVNEFIDPEWVVLTYMNNDQVCGRKTLTYTDVSGRESVCGEIKGVFGKCFDYENSIECYMFTGYDEHNNTVWGKCSGRR